jgi:chemotaxis protein MotB
LSADRANASRRELANAGMPEDKLARVVGMASSLLLDPSDPLSPSNRRISILVMTKDAEERLLGGLRVPLEVETETETPQGAPVVPPSR